MRLPRPGRAPANPPRERAGRRCSHSRSPPLESAHIRVDRDPLCGHLPTGFPHARTTETGNSATRAGKDPAAVWARRPAHREDRIRRAPRPRRCFWPQPLSIPGGPVPGALQSLSERFLGPAGFPVVGIAAPVATMFRMAPAVSLIAVIF